MCRLEARESMKLPHFSYMEALYLKFIPWRCSQRIEHHSQSSVVVLSFIYLCKYIIMKNVVEATVMF